MNKALEQLTSLFIDFYGKPPMSIHPVGHSGSERKYFRIEGAGSSVIGVFSENIQENRTYFYLTHHFRNLKLPVPDILAIGAEENTYLLEDLGDITLLKKLKNTTINKRFPDDILSLYQNVVEILPRFQVDASKNLDFSKCYPVAEFNNHSVFWDLNYFKYCFLKPQKVQFNEPELERDFQKFANYVTKNKFNYFMYRDFQARNIMIKNNKPYFIDSQGGRKGPLQYDVISLLYQVRANLPDHIRNLLMDHYLNKLGKTIKIDKKEFYKNFSFLLYLRIMQVLGAYGFRGLIERKKHFILSLPGAISLLKNTLQEWPLPHNLPEIKKILSLVSEIKLLDEKKSNKLTVIINSFSYKNGVPEDNSGNGGGFVFDCRALPNPGRDMKMQKYNGRDKIIIEYLNSKNEVVHFLDQVKKLIDTSIENYISRKFTRLHISFGCTGGQHRSVYCAEKLARHIKQKYPIIVSTNHRELHT